MLSSEDPIDALRQALSKLPPPKRGEGFSDLYLSVWNEFWDKKGLDGYALVVCDGSHRKSDFTGRISVVCVRAVAHVYGVKDFEPITEYRFLARDDAVSPGLFCKAVELELLRRVVEELLKQRGVERVLAILDGSLYPVYRHHIGWLEREQDVLSKALEELSKLLRMCCEGSLVALGVSKDSRVSYLRSKLLIDKLLRAKPTIGEEYAYDLRRKYRKPHKVVKRIRDILGSDLEGVESLLEELEHPISDEYVYSSMTHTPGYTTPLILSPITLYVYPARSWGESEFRKRLVGAELLRLVSALDELYSLPPVAITYWKPPGSTNAFRVDIPSTALGYDGPSWGDIVENVFFPGERWKPSLEELLSVLNGLGEDPIFIRPLVEVDEVARIKRFEYVEIIERLILDELRSMGYDVSVRRRELRDRVLRRV